METQIVQYQTKFKQLLEKLVNSNGSVAIESHLEELLKKLDGKSTLVYLPVFTEWLYYAVTIWWANEITPPAYILSFTLNLASFLMKTEEKFVFFNTDNCLLKLLSISKVRQSEVSQSVKLSYMGLLSSFVEHKSGLEWLIFHNILEDMLQLSLTPQSVSVTEKSHKFISQFIDRIINYDENICQDSVKRIMLPVSENIHRSLGTSNNLINLNNTFQNLESSLKLMANILEYFLDEVFYSRNDIRVLLIFSKNFIIEERLFDFLLICQNQNLAFDLCKIMFIMQFLELYVNVINNKISLVTANEIIEKIENNYILSVSRGSFEDVLKFSDFSHLYFKVISAKMSPYLISNQKDIIAFTNQFAILEVQPHFAIVLKYCQSPEQALEAKKAEYNDNSVNLFIKKIFQVCSKEVLRLLFLWRDLLPTFTNLIDLSKASFMCIKKSIKHYSREVAVIKFQSLLFSIRAIVSTMQQSVDFFQIIGNEYDYFSSAFDLLVILIEKFQITWRDCSESVDMMSIIFDFLCLSSWPSNVVVNALNAINISTIRYMTPNLALLVDRTAGSTMAMLGPLLLKNIYHEDSSLRRVGLEVICSIAHVSAKKFPSLQTMLIDAKLAASVLRIFISDDDASVRATSIKCLQEMIKAKEILFNVLNINQLLQNMKDILLNEKQAIIRVEAATFICIAYENQQIPKEILDKVFVTMVLSATSDIHCKVKIATLNFWTKVIDKHLQNQGMIDGSFPDVTFSKQHRKIIVLTDQEIQKRLQTVLDQLSIIGCLGVLVSTIKEDCDAEVSKVGLEITQKLVKLIKRYNVSDCKNVSVSPSVKCEPDYDEIITPNICWGKDDIQTKKFVASDDFLECIKEDLNRMVIQRKNYLSGIEDLGSFIDDMLNIYKKNNNLPTFST